MFMYLNAYSDTVMTEWCDTDFKSVDEGHTSARPALAQRGKAGHRPRPYNQLQPSRVKARDKVARVIARAKNMEILPRVDPFAPSYTNQERYT